MSQIISEIVEKNLWKIRYERLLLKIKDLHDELVVSNGNSEVIKVLQKIIDTENHK